VEGRATSNATSAAREGCPTCSGPTASIDLGADVLQGDPNGEVCIFHPGTENFECREFAAGYGDHSLSAVVASLRAPHHRLLPTHSHTVPSADLVR
jgi:hypothetical protein